MKIALTGATGFVGRFLARAFIAQGWQVQALARSPERQFSLPAGSIKWIKGDLANREVLQDLVSGADAVVHCAGAIRGVTLQDFQQVNLEGMQRLLDACTSQPTKPRFCLISSLAAREPGLSHYALSKQQGEQVLRQQNSLQNWVILRPPAIYGPEDPALLPLLKLIYRGIAPIAASDRARFSMIHVDDLVSAVVHWLQQADCPANIYEISDNHSYSWDEMIAAIGSLRNGRMVKIPLPRALLKGLAHINTQWATLRGQLPILTIGKVNELYHSDWICDNSHWSQATGWQPQISLTQGLQSCLCPTKTR